MAVLSIITDAQKGAAGRPFLSALIDIVIQSITLEAAKSAIDTATSPPPTAAMASSRPTAPKLQVNGLTSISETASPSSATPSDRSAMKLNMLRKIRPPPFRYAWTLYHEKNNTASDSYEDRLTCLLENIITIKTFWECVNQFPLQQLKMKDSVHFFKRGVRPVWEDPRNVEGGAWTFRVSKAVSAEFWVEVLLLAVGEQFSDVLGNGDDLCGISLSRRFSSDLIQIWNRRASDEASINGIRDVVLAQLSPNLKPKDASFYYKKHSEHQGFEEIVAAAKKRGEMEKETKEVAKVEDAEAEKVMMEEEDGEAEVEKANK
ncbi:MAG: hypothetical protein LQ338_003523 [Usnochroma carphineum]|nr:MAG: hypothetical protein LQ338_003523 [Usnochroma carphineum]